MSNFPRPQQFGRYKHQQICGSCEARPNLPCDARNADIRSLLPDGLTNSTETG